jgi:hopanoid biosynthesis associated protein HpnK
VKRLIVNADDFGMTGSVNRAIVESHQRGIVSSTTLLATGAALDEAIALARAHPRLAVGCHVALVHGNPLTPLERLPTLTCVRNPGDVRLRHGFAQFAAAALRGRVDAEEIQGEAEAQIRKLQAAGIAVSHFDTHKHVHLLPVALKPLLRAARNCGIRAVRNPFEPAQSVGLMAVARRPRLWMRYPVVEFLRRNARHFREQAAGEGFITTDGTIGITTTGSLDESMLAQVLRRLPEGTWELVCHPAYLDNELRSLSRLKAGERELAALTSPHIRQCLQECGIELTTYPELLREHEATAGAR